MYLARYHHRGITRYVIRQSYADQTCLRSRDLFDLGPDPTRYITYVGGSGYYYDEDMVEALVRAGIDADQDQLDRLFFEFLDPEIQRVIHGFDRGRRNSDPRAIADDSQTGYIPHSFDRRRYHYLRFGHSDQRHIDQVPEKVFSPLYDKSRDELEQYFLAEERILRHHEKPFYVATIFELKKFIPDKDNEAPLIDQMDAFFLSRLCKLNADHHFRSGMPENSWLHGYLAKYAVMYFDFDPPRRSPWQAYVEDFIHRHRIYHPPAKVTVKLEEAGRLFGLPWKQLRTLDRKSLSRLYRQLALQHHPDRGGDPDIFRRLTQYYKLLLKRK